jgi:hypothetical protein
MGQAKQRRRTAFAPDLIEQWEGDDCINFAVALARATGWILHVDWWSTSTEHDEDIPIERLSPLRVYVGDNSDRIFDVRGVRSLADFCQHVIVRVIQQRGGGNGCVYTRFYSESALSDLPLRSQPDEGEILRAMNAIQENINFLKDIPVRVQPYIPAHDAANYTFGNCAVFAEALRELTGLEPVAILAMKFSPMFERTKRSEDGYFHSVVLHPDGMAEDVWGKAPLDEIAGRFGVEEFTISSDEYRNVIARHNQSAPDHFAAAINDAKLLIRAHRPLNGID